PSISMRRQASLASKRSTRNALPPGSRSCDRSPRLTGVRRTSISKIRTATSSASAAVPRLALSLDDSHAAHSRAGADARRDGAVLLAERWGPGAQLCTGQVVSRLYPAPPVRQRERLLRAHPPGAE